MSAPFPALGLIVLFPALGALFNVFFGRRFGRTAVNLVGPGAMIAAFVAASAACARLMAMAPGSALEANLWPWIYAGSFHVDFALRLDALSAVMVLVVSGVGSLIFVYSTG